MPKPGSRHDAASRFYTKLPTWLLPLATLQVIVKTLNNMLIVDPFAGNGRMVDTFFPGGLKFDLEPKSSSVIKRNVYDLAMKIFGRDIAVISNMPWNAGCYPIRMLNHLAKNENVKVIAVILAAKYERYPRDSLDKSGVEFNRYFHLVKSVPIDGETSFSKDPEGKDDAKVACPVSFQIWVRKEEKRPKITVRYVCKLPDHMAEKPSYIIKAASKTFMDGYRCASPVMTPNTVKKGKPICYVAVRPADGWDVSPDRMKKDLETLVCHATKKYNLGSQSIGPGFLIQAQLDLGWKFQ